MNKTKNIRPSNKYKKKNKKNATRKTKGGFLSKDGISIISFLFLEPLLRTAVRRSLKYATKN